MDDVTNSERTSAYSRAKQDGASSKHWCHGRHYNRVAVSFLFGAD